MTQYLELYQSFSAEELASEISRLRALRTQTYSSATVGGVAGNKSYMVDLNRIDAMLQAAIRVQGQSRQTGNTSYGVVNFNQTGGTELATD